MFCASCLQVWLSSFHHISSTLWREITLHLAWSFAWSYYFLFIMYVCMYACMRVFFFKICVFVWKTKKEYTVDELLCLLHLKSKNHLWAGERDLRSLPVHVRFRHKISVCLVLITLKCQYQSCVIVFMWDWGRRHLGEMLVAWKSCLPHFHRIWVSEWVSDGGKEGGREHISRKNNMIRKRRSDKYDV